MVTYAAELGTFHLGTRFVSLGAPYLLFFDVFMHFICTLLAMKHTLYYSFRVVSGDHRSCSHNVHNFIYSEYCKSFL